MLSVNDLSTFPIKGNPVFSNGPKSLPKNPDWNYFMRDYLQQLYKVLKLLH